MKKIIRLLCLFILPGFFISCDTDFDVIADYKEIAVVYGLLNQNDTIHYLRINKAFLGPGNALTYAQVADSSSFGADIRVLLIEKDEYNIVLDTIVFDTVTLSNKQPGDFYSPNQLFYYSKAKLNQFNSYALSITHRKTGYEVNSVTKLIHDFNFSKPSPGAKIISFKRSITQPMKFSWENAVNGKRYQMIFTFNYKELGPTGDTTDRKIEWLFPERISAGLLGAGESDVSYANEDFFKQCESKIPYSDKALEDAVVKRFASMCDLEVTAIGDEFSTFLDANGPSTGVLIEKPVYSNINNGLGLLSCRYQTHKFVLLSPETILDLSSTTNLKFAKPTK